MNRSNLVSTRTLQCIAIRNHRLLGFLAVGAEGFGGFFELRHIQPKHKGKGG